MVLFTHLPSWPVLVFQNRAAHVHPFGRVELDHFANAHVGWTCAFSGCGFARNLLKAMGIGPTLETHRSQCWKRLGPTGPKTSLSQTVANGTVAERELVNQLIRKTVHVVVKHIVGRLYRFAFRLLERLDRPGKTIQSDDCRIASSFSAPLQHLWCSKVIAFECRACLAQANFEQAGCDVSETPTMVCFGADPPTPADSPGTPERRFFFAQDHLPILAKIASEWIASGFASGTRDLPLLRLPEARASALRGFGKRHWQARL